MKTKESNTSQVVKNSLWNALTVLIGKMGGLVFTIIIARFLLPEKFGIYTLAISIAFFVIALTNQGINQALSRYVSLSLSKNKKKQAAAYFNFIFKLKLLISFISAVAILVLAYPLSVYIFKKPALIIPLIFAAFYLFAISFQNFYETLFYVIKKVKYLPLKEIVLEVSKLSILLLLFFILSEKFGASSVIVTLAIASLIAFIYIQYILKKKIPLLFKKSSVKIDKNKALHFIKYSIASGISTTIFNFVDVITLGIFVTATYVGFYGAAYLIIAGFFGFLTIPNILLPIFTQMNKDNLSEAFNRLFKYTVILSIPLIFGIFVLGRYVLRLIFGYEYLSAALPMIFLSFLIFEIPIIEALKSLFLAREQPKFIARVSIISTVLNIFLNLVLILSLLKISVIWAVAGAAIATVTSKLFVLILLSKYAKQKLNVHYNLRLILKPLVSSILMASVLLFINSYVTDMNLLIGLGEVIVGVLVYITFMCLLKGITKHDFVVFKSLFK